MADSTTLDFSSAQAILTTESVEAHASEIHGVLTDDWPLSRIDSTLRAILRAGAFELNDRKDVPTAVIINEYVDIARAFFQEDDEPKLVNAVLDRLARQWRKG